MYLVQQEQNAGMVDQGSTNKAHTRRKHSNPRIVLTKGQEDCGDKLSPNCTTPTSKRQQKRKAKRRKRTKRHKTHTGEDELHATGQIEGEHVYSDTELPAILQRNSMSAGHDGEGRRDPENTGSSCSTLSLPPMPLGGTLTRRPDCSFGPLHNVPPLSHKQTSPRLQDRSQRAPHPFLLHRGVNLSDFKLKNMELGLNMYQTAKKLQNDDDEPRSQPRHLEDAIKIHLPSLTGVASGARLTLQ